eukprot:117476_1
MAEERKDLDVIVNQELEQASWIIQGDLMEKFKNANNGEEYSADFLLHGCIWTLNVYPNGNNEQSIDHVSIYLICKTLPSEYSKLGVTYQIALVEVNQVKNDGNFFVEGTDWGWSKFLKRDLTMEKLTINVKVFVSATIDRGCLIWKIDGPLLDIFKTCKTKTSYRSPPLEMFGIRWKVRCYPNGWYKPGAVDIDICPLEEYESLEIEYEIECKQADFAVISPALLGKDTKQIEIKNAFSFDVFRDSNEVIIKIRVWPSTMNDRDLYPNKSTWFKYCSKEETFCETIDRGMISWKIQTNANDNVLQLQLEKCLPG